MKLIKKAAAVTACLALAACVLPRASAQVPPMIRVACVGDSITQGWMATDLAKCSYPAQLGALLDTNHDVRNFGSGGLTAMKDYGDLVGSYWTYQNFFADSKAFSPNVVILMLGTNDAVVKDNGAFRADLGERYTADLKALVEAYLALDSHPKVYLCTPATAFDDAHPDRVQNIVVPAVRAVAEATGATLVDVNAHSADYKEKGFTDDGIHPNDEGYFDLAKFFYTTIFDGTISTVNVTAAPGLTVSIGGRKAEVRSSGKASLETGDGYKTMTVAEQGVGRSNVSFTVQGETTVNLMGLAVDRNFALSAAPLDSVGASAKSLNDGDVSTGWQASMGTPYTDLWAGYDFGEAIALSSAEIVWESATRCPEGGYRVELSADGQAWAEPDGVDYACGDSVDVVTFSPVAARYLRVKCLSGKSGIWRPQIFDLSVFDRAASFTPAVTYASAAVASAAPKDDTDKAPGVGTHLLVSAGVVAVAGLAAYITGRIRKGKKDKDGKNGGRRTIS